MISASTTYRSLATIPFVEPMLPSSTDPVNDFRIAVVSRSNSCEQAQRIVASLANDLNDQGVKITLLLGASNSTGNWDFNHQCVSTETIHSSWLRRIFGYDNAVGKAIGRIRPKVLLVFDELIKNIDLPQIVYHTDKREVQPTRETQRLATVKGASVNVFDSEALKNELLKRYSGTDQDNYHVVHFNGRIQLSPHVSTRSGGETDLRQDIPQHIPVNHEATSETIAVMIGPQPEQQLAYLVDILDRLNPLDSPIRFVAHVVGDVSASLQEAYGRPKLIHWSGKLSRNNLDRLLEGCTCLLADPGEHSRSEQALIAMENSCPVVGFNHGDLPDQLADAAVLCQVGNLTAVADAIETLAQDPQVRRDFVEFGLARLEQLNWSGGRYALSQLLVDVAGRQPQ